MSSLDEAVLHTVVKEGLGALPSVPPDARRVTRIGPLYVEGHAVLAPMSGVCDRAFRLLCRRGGASVVYNEFISSDGLVRDSGRSRRMMEFSEAERPFAVQIFGSDPTVMAEAVRLVEDNGVDLIDLNFGCPVKKVVKREAGSALLRNPILLGSIMHAAATAARRVPVTAKIRTGWNSDVACDIARICEENGAAAVTVHARTQSQGYAGSADWRVIARVVHAVNVPVLGNGDVAEPEDAFRLIDETGCALAMIGRAARVTPWIFAGVNARARSEELSEMTWGQRFRIMKAHLALMILDKGEHVATMQFRSRLCNYVKTMPGATAFRRMMMSVDDAADVLSHLDRASERLSDEPCPTFAGRGEAVETEEYPA